MQIPSVTHCLVRICGHKFNAEFYVFPIRDSALYSTPLSKKTRNSRHSASEGLSL